MDTACADDIGSTRLLTVYSSQSHECMCIHCSCTLLYCTDSPRVNLRMNELTSAGPLKLVCREIMPIHVLYVTCMCDVASFPGLSSWERGNVTIAWERVQLAHVIYHYRHVVRPNSRWQRQQKQASTVVPMEDLGTTGKCEQVCRYGQTPFTSVMSPYTQVPRRRRRPKARLWLSPIS